MINGRCFQSSAANRIALTIPLISKLCVIELALLGILFFHQPLFAFSSNQENLKQLRERIGDLQKDLAIKHEIKQETSNALSQIQESIMTMTQRLAKLREEDQQAVAAYRQLQIQYQHTKKQIDEEQERLGSLLYQQYLEGKQDYLRLVINQQHPSETARAAYYYRQLSLARVNAVQELQINQEKLQILLHTSRQKKEEIAAIQVEFFEQRKKLEQEKAKHQNLLAQVSVQITKQLQEIEKLKTDEQQLNKLIHEIDFKPAAKVSPAINQPLINNKVPDDSVANTPFSSLKGKLNLPVRGKLVNAFGGQRSGKQLTWKGLFIQSNEGSEVKAISSGKVLFADWLRGFGHLIILDHGNGYMSLYGNNATLHRQVGDTIRSGDMIATVGSSSGNLDTGLYFELRHQGKPFDPMIWIKIE